MSTFDLGVLADELVGPGKTDSDIIQGTVISRESNNTYTVTLRGDSTSIPGIRSMVPLIAGDVVWLVQKGGFLLIINNQDTGWHYVGTAGEPAFANGWQNYEPGQGYANPLAAFRKVGGIVYIQGLIMRPAGPPAADTEIFTLPVGYRPRANHHVIQASYLGQQWLMRIDGVDFTSRAGRIDIADTIPNYPWADISHSFVAEG